MMKVLLGLVLVSAIILPTQQLTFDLPDLTVTEVEWRGYLEGCFLGILVPETRSLKYTVNQLVVQEMTNFVIKAHPSVFAGNSAFQRCVDMFPQVQKIALKECSRINGGAECEIVDKIVATKKCPAGFSRVSSGNAIDSTSCYQECPAGFTAQGPICVKPDTYVLNNFRNELECIGNNNNKPCSIYHVRYFVPDCKEGFYRLGSTVCIPRCPENFEDHETFCLRPTIQVPKEQTVVYDYKLGAPGASTN